MDLESGPYGSPDFRPARRREGLIRSVEFYATRVGMLVAFAGAAYCLGSSVLRRLEFVSRPERFAFSTTFGLGGLGALFFLLATLHLFNVPAVILVLLGCYATAWPRRREAAVSFLRALGECRTARGAGLAMIGALLLITMLLTALYPPLDADTTMYHFPAARAFAAAHSIPALTNLRYPVFPQLHELLCAAGLLFRDDLLAPTLCLLWCLLVVSALAAWAMRVGDPRVGIWAIGLWIGSPIVLFLARSGHVELGLAAFVTVAILATDLGLETRDRRWLYVAGALAGWAAATKYTGLYFVVALGVVVLGRSPRRSRGRDVGAFALSAAAAAGPWYARSFVLSGNPVWPFLGSLFGYRFWTAGDVASTIWSLRQEGEPRTAWAFLKLPWSLGWNQSPGVGRLAPALFGLFPIGVVSSLLTSRRQWLLGVAVGFLAFWFLTTQQIRFLIPVVPLVCVLTAQGSLRFADSFLRSRRSMASIALTVCLFGALVVPRILDTWKGITQSGLPPVDDRARATFLAQRVPSYPLYRWLNQKHGRRYTIYAFHDEPMKYYCDGTQLGDWFGRGRYRDVDLSTGQRLLASLKRLDAQYLLVNNAVYPTRLPDDPFFKAHFVPIFAGNWVIAFRLQ